MSYDRQSRPLLAACSSEWPVPHMFSHCLLGGGSGGFRLWATQPVLLGIYLCMLLFQRMCSQLGILGSKCLQSFNHQIAFWRGATDVHSLRVRGPRLGGGSPLCSWRLGHMPALCFAAGPEAVGSGRVLRARGGSAGGHSHRGVLVGGCPAPRPAAASQVCSHQLRGFAVTLTVNICLCLLRQDKNFSCFCMFRAFGLQL